MVRRFLTILFLLIISWGYGQTVNLGGMLLSQQPNYQTDNEKFYISYVEQFGGTTENQEIILEQKGTYSAITPSVYLNFTSKNRFSLTSRVNATRTVFVYDVGQSFIDLGIRLVTVDVDNRVGYNLTLGKFISLIPEVGIQTRTPISIRDGVTYDEKFFYADESINNVPELTGSRAGYLINQPSDFKPVTAYWSAGLKIQWYNFFASASYEANLTSIDNRDFYKSSNQISIAIGMDLLSIYTIKNQGRKFEN